MKVAKEFARSTRGTAGRAEGEAKQVSHEYEMLFAESMKQPP